MTATIDPRIRERRIEVKREAGRKRLRILLLAVCTFLAFGTAFLVAESPLLDVDHVRVGGTSQLPESVVRDAAGVDPGVPLPFLDTGEVRARIERLPWVADATVSRRWPGTVRINVRERVPAAYALRQPNQAVLLDATGFAIADVPAPVTGLVEVRGATEVPPVGGRLTAATAPSVIAQLPAELAGRVSAVDVGSGMTLLLHGGGEIRLCNPDHLGAKTAAALAVMTRLGAPFSYIDVCVPHAPVAR